MTAKPKPNSLISSPSHAAGSGFALVATLSLMVLLAVLSVGLLSLSAVSLRVSSQGSAMAEARANARLALMLAIGELQNEMGPDSRITAPHDAGTAAPNGQARWTAVYDAWQSPADPNTPDDPALRIPKFRRWLVSGANQATGGEAGTSEQVLLLGPNSLGGTATAEDEVRVPMQEVSTGKQRGRLAWWIADEATKAKVNAGPDADASSSFGVSDPLFHAQSPANIGHRTIPKLEEFDWKPGDRAKSSSLAQVNLAAGLNGATGLGNISHDFTTSSAGILADVRSGRLRRDLSNLLARPIEELENKPLFLANGRINNFNISEQGAVSNSQIIGANTPRTANEWGINMEELALFHQLPRELAWKGGAPSLVAKSTREAAVQDRHFIYRKPTVEAAQFIFSLKAVPGTGSTPAAPLYKMQMMLDGVVVLSNPNDIRMEIPPGLALPLQLTNVPYDLKWNIKRSGTPFVTSSSTADPLEIFRGYIEGSDAPAGFLLEPGEAAAFGSSAATGYTLNLKRGFVPSGGVTMTDWHLTADNLKADDDVDFEMIKSNSKPGASSFVYYTFWIGPRTPGASGKGWQIETAGLTGKSNYGVLMDQLLPPSIKPPQVRPVSDFVDTPQPILLLSFVRNVEQASTASPPDAFVSRPFLLNDAAWAGHSLLTDDLTANRHISQTLITAESMNYQFRTLAAGAGGRNAYHGGGRQPNLGGSFNVIKRRIPMAPPLSLGAFQNAIAGGLVRMNEPGAFPAIATDPIATNAVALSPWRRLGASLHEFSLAVSHATGNSFCPPFLDPNQVYRAHTSLNATNRSACDYSWMANTALWDSWHLSGIVDGTGVGSSQWQSDARSPRGQFLDLATGKKPLRNKRLLFHPHQTPDAALAELFDGENFKPGAINNLAKYLLIDGAFNVNSTSTNAWRAFLTSVRDQEILKNDGKAEKFDHPFGTLGYAHDTSTSGTAGDWIGLRNLTEDEMDGLAAAMVTEVKARGPFLSMADFVNRRPNSDVSEHQSLGALQAAINRSGLNDHLTGAGRKVTDADFAPLPGIGADPAPARAVGGRGYLNQADILTAIGSQITVRSDTFTIRAYGEARDSGGSEILARAWCEAVIQRVPEYVDPTDAPQAQNGWPQAGGGLTAVNTRFGRRFLIQSFRWLDGAEI
jgi:hypothetical protein